MQQTGNFSSKAAQVMLLVELMGNRKSLIQNCLKLTKMILEKKCNFPYCKEILKLNGKMHITKFQRKMLHLFFFRFQ